MERGTYLFRLAMQRMLAAARTEFLQLHAARVVPAVFLAGVITFLTFSARQVDDGADIFLGCHNFLYCACHLGRGATPSFMQ
jgi:hypothetical protein